MTKLEEAWGELSKHFGVRRHNNGDDWKYCRGEAEARAYALAVMEKALMVGSADHIDDYDAGAEALRREIEELGR